MLAAMSEPRPATADLRRLVERSRGGDAGALESLLVEVRDPVHRLALRMTAHPQDAEDATQEILIKVMTRLDSYRGDAAVTTWVYRIASNHLLDRAKSVTERMTFTFSSFADDLHAGLAAPSARTDPDHDLLAREVKQGCTLALLTCLDREARLAYVLGEIVEVPTADGAAICAISEAAYRKRLSRARQKVRAFLEENCGLVSPESAACHCRRRVPAAIAAGRVDPAAAAGTGVEEATAEIERVYDAAQLLRSRSDEAAPARLTEQLVGLIRSDGPLALLPEARRH
jgi:RNA polymerase sigma factor (sigma-70 family)